MNIEWLKQRRWVWGVPLVLILVNGALLSTYRLIYAGRVALLRGQIGREAQDLAELAEQSRHLETLVEGARRSRDGVERLYRESFATEGERLSRMIREVKDLASRAGLVPASIGYPEEELEDQGLIQRAMVFSVEGEYSSLRKFVNLLEIADTFVVLEAVRLNESDPSLRIGLELSTLFVGRDQPATAALAASGEPAGGGR